MCDYSLLHLKSRPAEIDDELEIRSFGYTKGLRDSRECVGVVCLTPGTEVSFQERPLAERFFHFFGLLGPRKLKYKEAKFIQVDVDSPCVHHDAFEFPDGEIVKIHWLVKNQKLRVLQLPSQPSKSTEKPELPPLWRSTQEHNYARERRPREIEKV